MTAGLAALVSTGEPQLDVGAGLRAGLASLPMGVCEAVRPNTQPGNREFTSTRTAPDRQRQVLRHQRGMDYLNS